MEERDVNQLLAEIARLKLANKEEREGRVAAEELRENEKRERIRAEEQRERERKAGRLRQDGFKNVPLHMTSTSQSLPSTDSSRDRHKACPIIERPDAFKITTDLENVLLWEGTELHNASSDATVTNEMSAQSLVKAAMDDVLKSIGVSSLIHVEQQKNVDEENIPDVLLLRGEGGMLLLVVECKVPDKPGRNLVMTTEPSVVTGQIYDQLHAARRRFGLREAMGLIWTYAHMRVVWLPEADWLIRADVQRRHVVQQNAEGLLRIRNSVVRPADGEAGKATVPHAESGPDRVLFGSRMYTVAEDGQGELCVLLQVLASLVVKCLATQTEAGFGLPRNGALSLARGVFSAATRDGTALAWTTPDAQEYSDAVMRNIPLSNPSTFINFQSNIFFATRLGGGRDGSAFMSFSVNNHRAHAFVTKVFRLQAHAEKELAFWNAVYSHAGKPLFHYPHVVTRSRFHCILLPYLWPLTDGDKNDAKVATKLDRCLATYFWRKSIAHNDIRWCNMGWADSSKETLVLFDLFACTEHTSPAVAREVDMGSDSEPIEAIKALHRSEKK